MHREIKSNRDLAFVAILLFGALGLGFLKIKDANDKRIAIANEAMAQEQKRQTDALENISLAINAMVPDMPQPKFAPHVTDRQDWSSRP